MQSNSNIPRPGRHLKEKYRREQMKSLYSRLTSLVSTSQNSLKTSPAALDVLDKATNYIKQLEDNVNELKARMTALKMDNVVIVVHESEAGENLVINIECGLEKKKLKMHKIFQILKEEGAEVVSASYCIADLKIYHTILCKAFTPRLGMDSTRVQERLNNLISST